MLGLFGLSFGFQSARSLVASGRPHIRFNSWYSSAGIFPLSQIVDSFSRDCCYYDERSAIFESR